MNLGTRQSFFPQRFAPMLTAWRSLGARFQRRGYMLVQCITLSERGSLAKEALFLESGHNHGRFKGWEVELRVTAGSLGSPKRTGFSWAVPCGGKERVEILLSRSEEMDSQMEFVWGLYFAYFSTGDTQYAAKDVGLGTEVRTECADVHRGHGAFPKGENIKEEKQRAKAKPWEVAYVRG